MVVQFVKFLTFPFQSIPVPNNFNLYECSNYTFWPKNKPPVKNANMCSDLDMETKWLYAAYVCLLYSQRTDGAYVDLARSRESAPR